MSSRARRMIDSVLIKDNNVLNSTKSAITNCSNSGAISSTSMPADQTSQEDTGILFIITYYI